MAVDPGGELGAIAGDRVPAQVEIVVAGVVAVRIGRPGAARAVRDGRHREVRQHDVVHRGRNLVDDRLDGDEQLRRGECGLARGADDPVDRDIAAAVRALRVQDRDVGIDRGHGRDLLAGVGAGDVPDARILLRKIGADVAAEHPERQARGARAVGNRHGGVAVLVDLERARPVVLDRVAQAMQRADTGIAAPGESQLARAAGPDQLVVDEVRRHAHEVQVAPALANQLMAGRKGNEMREALEREAGAVRNVRRDRLRKRQELRHSLHHGPRLFAQVQRQVISRCDRLAGGARAFPSAEGLVARPGAGRRALRRGSRR